jgi:hypothetical protein
MKRPVASPVLGVAASAATSTPQPYAYTLVLRIRATSGSRAEILLASALSARYDSALRMSTTSNNRMDPSTTGFHHDAAGNMTYDGTHHLA